MGGYIRMDKDLEDDPRVKALAEVLARSHLGLIGDEPDDGWSAPQRQILGLARDALLGGLYRLWRHADTYLGRHDRLKGASPTLAGMADVTGLPLSLLKRFPKEWLKHHPDGSIELPGYAAKNVLMDRDMRRASGRERTAKWREKKRRLAANGDASPDVTNAVTERHKSVSTGTGTGTGTGTETSETGTGTALASLACGADAPSSASREGEKAPAFLPPHHLESMARRLGKLGRTPAAIAEVLKPRGATDEQLAKWASTPEPEPGQIRESEETQRRRAQAAALAERLNSGGTT